MFWLFHGELVSDLSTQVQTWNICHPYGTPPLCNKMTVLYKVRMHC